MIWQDTFSKNFRTLDALADFLQLEAPARALLVQDPAFSLNVPLRLAEKMAKGDIHDPLFRQFVPLQEELESSPGFLQDPVGDLKVQRTKRLLQKYEGRALLVSTGACAMHCRYCFRRNFPYENLEKTFQDELAILKADTSLDEIILSGGDPLSLSNRVLKEFLQNVAKLHHIKRVRFHTRFILGIPERVDTEFLQILADVPEQLYFLIHCNHPREIDSDVTKAIKQLQKLGIPVLNQAVLLKGVNDSLEILTELYRNLANMGVQAYYLNQLDRVQGAKHFEVDVEKGISLVQQLSEILPGYAVPKYVQEISGMPSKTPVSKMLDFRN